MTSTPGGTLPAKRDQGKSVRLVSRPHLFVVLECDRPLALSSRHSIDDADTVLVGRGSARRAERDQERQVTVRVPDARMSSRHALMYRRDGAWWLEDAGSRNGTLVDGVGVDRHRLRDGDVFECGHTLLMYREDVRVRVDEEPDFDAAKQLPPAPGLLTLSPAFARDLAALQRLARSDVSILLLGDSGTGKEITARAIAKLSKRAGKLVAVNCGAIPETLIEAELFGCKKGAFSGATEDRIGLVRSADGGTLFLDEIANLPPSSQAALLRVLQEREVRPVGSPSSTPVDIRVVAATNEDVERLVSRGEFRRDLYARLAGFTMTLPPLRKRREDLGVLIGTLLAARGPERVRDVTFEPAAARALLDYPWPLNVRELENTLETALALAAGAPIACDHLPPTILEPAPAGDGDLSPEQDQHRRELVASLRRHRGNLSAVARDAGKARQQIHRWMKRYGIDPDDFR